MPRFYGIDIGKNTIKVAIVKWDETKPVVDFLLTFQTGAASLTSEDVNARTDLVTRIRETLKASGINTNKAVVALPEPVVFNRLITYPKMNEKTLNQAIHWNAKKYLPVPESDVQMDWILTNEFQSEGKDMMQLLLVAAPKKLIKQTTVVFRDAEQELLAIETEAVATSRVIAHNYPEEKSILVVDIGSAGTDISIVSKKKLIFSQSLGTGSHALTRAIAVNFSLEESQAEQYKIKVGLVADQMEGKILQVLTPVMNVITSELEKTINFFRTKLQDSIPTKVLLVGDGAKLPGLTEFLAPRLGLPVELANLTRNMTMSTNAQKNQPTDGLFDYAVALGLAMKTPEN